MFFLKKTKDLLKIYEKLEKISYFLYTSSIEVII